LLQFVDQENERYTAMQIEGIAGRDTETCTQTERDAESHKDRQRQRDTETVF